MDEAGCCPCVATGLAGSAAGADGFCSTVCDNARPAITRAIRIRPTIGFCFAVILPHLPWHHVAAQQNASPILRCNRKGAARRLPARLERLCPSPRALILRYRGT